MGISNRDQIKHHAVFAVPIILTVAVVDPLLGELRGNNVTNKKLQFMIGVIAAYIVWGASFSYLPLEKYWWVAMIAAPVGVLAEFPRLKYIDDNGLMVLAPLAV